MQVIDNHAETGGRASVYRESRYLFDAGSNVITAPFLFDELFTYLARNVLIICSFSR